LRDSNGGVAKPSARVTAGQGAIAQAGVAPTGVAAAEDGGMSIAASFSAVGAALASATCGCGAPLSITGNSCAANCASTGAQAEVVGAAAACRGRLGGLLHRLGGGGSSPARQCGGLAFVFQGRGHAQHARHAQAHVLPGSFNCAHCAMRAAS
jgi:hypothetical protein